MKKHSLVLGLIVFLIGSTVLFAEDFSIKNILDKTKTANEYVVRTQTYHVTCYRVNLRSDHSNTSSIVAVLLEGTHVTGMESYTANGKTWIAVSVIDGPHAGETGWVIDYCLSEGW